MMIIAVVLFPCTVTILVFKRSRVSADRLDMDNFLLRGFEIGKPGIFVVGDRMRMIGVEILIVYR